MEKYRAAVAAAPRYVTAHLNLAIALEHSGARTDAAEAYERAVALDDRDPYVGYNFARFLYLHGQLARAAALLENVVRGRSPFADAWILLSAVLEGQGRLADASAALESALALEPRHGGALRNYALNLAQRGHLSEAAGAFERLIALEPADPALRCHLGNLLADAGRLDEAAGQYGAALTLDPGFLEARRGLCMLDCERGALASAICGLEALLAAHPGYLPGHLSLAAALTAHQRPDAAAQALRDALRLDPSCVEALVRLGDLGRDPGGGPSAVESYRRAMALDPEHVRARWGSVIAHLRPVWPDAESESSGRLAFAQALDAFAAWLRQDRLVRGVEAVGSPPPFALAYQAVSNRALLERHGTLCHEALSAWWQHRAAPVPARHAHRTRVRIGVVSAHFWDHSVWNAITRGWFEVFDRSRFEVEAFHVGFEHDPETARAQSLAARFEQGSSSLSHWAGAIAARQPDVLLYPEIGMDAMTLKLASLRLAPLQVASWGHPETTGLPTIDAFLSAQGMEPEDADASYSERLVRLPNLGCWYPRRNLLTEPPEIAGLELGAGVPVLVCPGTPFKYAPAGDRLLVDIAAALGECRLVLFTYRVPRLSQDLEERLARAFSARGMDATRFVRFVPWQTPARFRGLMARADAFLDTAGFSGFNTAIEALQSGLPVVAWEGRFLRGRFASGILRHLGLDELVASDPGSYAALAVALCRDKAFARRMRERIAAKRGILYEDEQPVRALEAFLEQAVRARS